MKEKLARIKAARGGKVTASFPGDEKPTPKAPAPPAPKPKAKLPVVAPKPLTPDAPTLAPPSVKVTADLNPPKPGVQSDPGGLVVTVPAGTRKDITLTLTIRIDS